MARTGRPLGRPTKLTGEDMLILTRMHQRGMGSTKIAKVLSTPERPVSVRTVALWLARAKAPTEAMQMAMAAGRMDMIDNWQLAAKRGARDGRHAPAKDWLIATGTIDAQHSDRVVVLINSPQTHTLAASRPSLPDIVIPQRPERVGL